MRRYGEQDRRMGEEEEKEEEEKEKEVKEEELTSLVAAIHDREIITALTVINCVYGGGVM